MKIVIISGGNIEDDFALDFLRKNPYDRLIAADRGAEFCRRHRVKPDVLVGDFDSAGAETVACFEREGVPLRRLSPRKDFSDTQSAAELALEMGAEELVLLGATGTRLDHVWANILLLLWGEERGIAMSLVDRCNRITVHRSSFSMERAEQFGTYVSLYALDGAVEELTLQGFAYPLTKHRLTSGDVGLTVSNEITDRQAQVRFRSGTLLLIESRDAV